MPICERCEKEKNIEEFSKRHPQNCLWCRKQIAQEKFDKSEKGKLKAKRFSISEKGKLNNQRKNIKKQKSGYKKKWRSSEEQKKKEIEYNKKYSAENRQIKNAHAKTQRERYPEKESARNKLKRAVRLGRIIKPKICSKCNCEPNIIEGHHEDYTKPFDVIWLCSSCHRMIHK